MISDQAVWQSVGRALDEAQNTLDEAQNNCNWWKNKLGELGPFLNFGLFIFNYMMV